jgi:hypothetical protein
MLIRRAIRKHLMARMGLRANNIESHVNGSITIALRMEIGPLPQAEVLETFVTNVRDTLASQSIAIEPVSGGVKGSVVWFRFSNPEMREEAVGKYGSSIHPSLVQEWGAFTSAIRGAVPVQPETVVEGNGEPAEVQEVGESIVIPEPSAADAEVLAMLEPSEV